ncbi:hypothetical protein [Micromonospora mirobrigensis]|uniref:DUF3558 domain-containing protein n=1 Tax=Micromonospora mirobrigensis TaxID=262898 RepID=A0A1C4W7H5_9ACTN|nr:hypothetical protein [Micromonospora mirobrigensis]SCE92160.1 hypothetical protein GA0070564_10260 [Micromonospora mirobrigensis]
MRASRLVTAVALPALLLAAGCGSTADDAEQPDPAPTTAAVGTPPVTEAATSGARWSGLTQRCPALTSAAARTWQATGAGTPDRTESGDGTYVTTAGCAWGAAAQGGRPGVNAKVTVYLRVPAGGDVTKEATSQLAGLLAGIRAEAGEASNGGRTVLVPEATPGDEAFTVLYPAERVAATTVRSANAVVTVRLLLGRSPENRLPVVTGQLRALRPQLRELAADVLDDLR